MTTYVDDMRAKYGRMIMCHMLADSDEELHAMAAQIGVARRWHQAPPRHDSHYDIALSKRAQAVAAGAVEITWRQAGCMTMRRRVTGELGRPEDAERWAREHIGKCRKDNPVEPGASASLIKENINRNAEMMSHAS